jgi:predicted metal-binding protein
MSDPQVLSVGEFQRSMKQLERSLNTRFDSTDERLEEIRAEQRDALERIAVLEVAKKNTNKKAFSLSGVAALVGIAITEGLRQLLG